MASTLVPSDWEAFDAEALFPPPRLHANKLTKIDPVNLQQADQSMLGEQSQNPSSDSQPKDGDMMAPVNQETGHEDQLFEMEGNGGQADDREIQADREEDHRSKEPEDSKEPEGADKPIQKKSEGVEEVAEATSKLSEDVHGGDEATKDIKDSPNAADDGENPDNHGAESGEGGQDGDDSASSDAELSAEDWEAKADHSAYAARVEDALYEWTAQPKPKTTGGGGKGVDYRGFQQWTPQSTRVIFQKIRELIAKLVEEEDPSVKTTGNAHWWARQIVKESMSFRHQRIPSARYDRPKEHNIVFFVDISGSVSSLAELFMALMGGAAGLPGVRIVVGSEAHAESEIVLNRPFRSVEKAMEFFRRKLSDESAEHEMGNNAVVKDTWYRPYDYQFEPGIVEYLQDHGLYNSTTTCVFFGDMQGVHFDSAELHTIVRSCKCLWLFTDEPGHYTHTGDLPKAIEAKLPIVYNVRDASSFAKAVRRLSSIRPGMQLSNQGHSRSTHTDDSVESGVYVSE